jgi:diguanylate cyclase (GGDEF)-like protein
LIDRSKEGVERTFDIDPLTDFYGRRLFVRYVEQELERSRRHGHTCALVFFTLRDWKTIQTHGSELTDAILANVAYACRASLRSYDCVGRTAENEFAVLLPQADSQVARTAAKRIAEHFTPTLGRLPPQHNIALEFGTATYPFDGNSASALLETAATHRMSFTADMKDIHIPW